MAFEDGDNGRLVRLADVLRWLQSSREVPRTKALKLLCDEMPAEVMGWLYWLHPTDYATAVSSNYAFNYETAELIAARKAQDRQNAIQKGLELERSYGRFGVPAAVVGGRISVGYPEPTEPGLPALLKRLQSLWVLTKFNRAATCDVLDDPRTRVHALAIRLDKAHALWVYGRVVATEPPAALPATLSRARGAAWSDDERAALLKEFDAMTNLLVGERHLALAKKHGTGKDNIKKQLATARANAKTALKANLFPLAK